MGPPTYRLVPTWLRTIGRALLWALAIVGAVVTLGSIRPRRPRLDDVADDLGAAAERARHAGESSDEAYSRSREETQSRIEAARETRLADEHAEAERLRADRYARRKAAESMLMGDDL